MAPLSVTLNDSQTRFQGHAIICLLHVELLVHHIRPKSTSLGQKCHTNRAVWVHVGLYMHQR